MRSHADFWPTLLKPLEGDIGLAKLTAHQSNNNSNNNNNAASAAGELVEREVEQHGLHYRLLACAWTLQILALEIFFVSPKGVSGEDSKRERESVCVLMAVQVPWMHH